MAATITVVCPQCKNRMKASTQHIGRQGRCPACNALVPIKAIESDSAVSLLPEDPSQRSFGRGGGGATDVDPWLPAAIGLTVTLFLQVIFVLLHRTNPDNRVGQFMTHNFAQPVLTFVCCWAISLLIMKYRAVQRQLVDPERELELIPLDIGMQITAGNVDQFLNHLNRLPAERQGSILLRRIRGALEYFKFRNSVPEVQSYLSTQAEIDASGVDSGYTLLRAFIWVCPILGFVGTVIGISVAINELRSSIAPPAPAAVSSSADAEPADNLNFEAMKEGMRGVTSGLATAFDTTLYGLVATILLLFPTELLRKSEYAALDKIEVYANESLLRRMSEGGPALDKDPAGFAREALQTAFQQHQQWLAQWQDQVARLGQTIGGKFEISLGSVVQKLMQDEATRLERMGQIGQSLDRILDEAHRGVEAAGHASFQSSTEAQRAAQAMSQMLERLSDSAQVLTRILDQHQKLAGSTTDGDLIASLNALRRDLQQLAGRSPLAPSASPEAPLEADLVPDHSASELGGQTRRMGWFGHNR
jgi:biopolymer transport protein ExbB/TolQ